MTLGERIRQCRLRDGLSQEKLAELAGVSRQAVTKWEMGQSSPSTANLFKLAEILGTTTDLLLREEESDGRSRAEEVRGMSLTEEDRQRSRAEEVRGMPLTEEDRQRSRAEEIRRMYQEEEEEKAARCRIRIRDRARMALLTAAGYLLIYLLGRLIWCSDSQNSLMGWLIYARPSGESSYLYGWLLSSRLFWAAMVISVIPALFGRKKFSFITLAGFVMGMLLGILFGPNPFGAPYGQSHYGWVIWGAVYLISMIVGILFEVRKESRTRNSKESRDFIRR